MFMNRKSSLPVMAALLASAAATSVASADISNVVFTIVAEATDSSGNPLRAEYNALFNDGYFDPDAQEYTWELPQQINLMSSNGTILGGISTARVFCREDPQVDLNFSVFAGALNTTFTITSPTLGFATLNNTVGRTSASLTMTDLDGDGVTMSGWNGNSIYTSRYNGAVPGGTTFHDHFLGAFGSPDPFGSYSDSQNNPLAGYEPIAPAVSDMSSRFRFTLTANDIAGGTSVYEILPIPAPGAVTLLGLGGILVGRRRR